MKLTTFLPVTTLLLSSVSAWTAEYRDGNGHSWYDSPKGFLSCLLSC